MKKIIIAIFAKTIVVNIGGISTVSDSELQEWHKQRSKGIGGSEISAILGKSDYMTNVQLWEYKTGRKKAPDISQNERVKYGNAAENPLIQLFILDFPQYEVYTGKEKNNIVNPEYSFIRGSCDALLIEKSTGRKGFQETKTALIQNGQQLKKWDKQIPENYFLQTLQYFLVNPEHQFCEVWAKLDFGWDRYSELRPYHLERSDFEEDIEYIKNIEIDWWQKYVEADVQPALLLPI